VCAFEKVRKAVKHRVAVMEIHLVSLVTGKVVGDHDD
jgi:hypothetical protein